MEITTWQWFDAIASALIVLLGIIFLNIIIDEYFRRKNNKEVKENG